MKPEGYNWDSLKSDMSEARGQNPDVILCSEKVYNELVKMHGEAEAVWAKRRAWPRWRYRLWMWWQWVCEGYGRDR